MNVGKEASASSLGGSEGGKPRFFFKFFTPVLAVNIYNIFSLLRTNYNHNIKNSKDNDHDRARKKTPTCLLNKFGLLFFLFMCEVHMAL